MMAEALHRSNNMTRACPVPIPRQMQLSRQESVLQVVLADTRLGSSLALRRILFELKECRISICTNREEFSSIIRELRPELIVFSYRFLEGESLHTLKEVHRQNPSTYLMVHMPKDFENLRSTLLMGGADNCVVVEQNDIQSLAGTIKKALILISEKCLGDTPGHPEEQLSEVVFSLDPDGRFTYINSAVTLLLGYDSDDLLHTYFLDLISLREPRNRFQTYLRNAPQAIMFQGDLPLRTSLGIEEEFTVRFILMEGEILHGTAKKVSLCAAEEDWRKVVENEGRNKQSSDPSRRKNEPQSPLKEAEPYRVLEQRGDLATGNDVFHQIAGYSNFTDESQDTRRDKTKGNVTIPKKPARVKTAQAIPSGSVAPEVSAVRIDHSPRPEGSTEQETVLAGPDSVHNERPGIHFPGGENRHPEPLKNQLDQEQQKAVEKFVESAIEEYRNRNYWNAVQFCKKAIEYREDYRLYHLMGKAFATHPGFARDAMNAYKKALELKPYNVNIQKEMADLHMSMGHFTLALIIYKKILEKEPQDPHCRSRIKKIESRNSVWNTLARKLSGLFKSQ